MMIPFSDILYFRVFDMKMYIEAISLICAWKYRQFDVVQCWDFFIKFLFEKNKQVLKFFKFLKIWVFLKNGVEKLHNFFRILRTSRVLNVHQIVPNSYYFLLRILWILKTSRPKTLFYIIRQEKLYDFL